MVKLTAKSVAEYFELSKPWVLSICGKYGWSFKNHNHVLHLMEYLCERKRKEGSRWNANIKSEDQSRKVKLGLLKEALERVASTDFAFSKDENYMYFYLYPVTSSINRSIEKKVRITCQAFIDDYTVEMDPNSVRVICRR